MQWKGSKNISRQFDILHARNSNLNKVLWINVVFLRCSEERQNEVQQAGDFLKKEKQEEAFQCSFTYKASVDVLSPV